MNLQMKLYAGIGLFLSFLFVLWYGYSWGADVEFTKSEARQKVAIQAALVTYKKRVTQAVNAADNYEKDKIKLEDTNVKLEERIQAYFDKLNNPDRSCFDANGLQLFNDISEGRGSPDTSQLKRTMQKGFTEIKGWQPKFYTHQSKRYLLPVRELS